MKHTLLTTALAALLTALPIHAQSGVPLEMSYQATLTDDNGDLIAPTTPTPYQVIMRIYDAAAGGALLWSEAFNDVPVFKGRFSIILGQGGPVPLAAAFEPHPPLDTIFANSSERFTEITLEEQGSAAKTFSPRQKLVSSSTAFVAKTAELAKVAERLAPNGLTIDAIPLDSIPSAMLESVDASKIGNGQFSLIDNDEFNHLDGIDTNIKTELDNLNAKLIAAASERMGIGNSIAGNTSTITTHTGQIASNNSQIANLQNTKFDKAGGAITGTLRVFGTNLSHQIAGHHHNFTRDTGHTWFPDAAGAVYDQISILTSGAIHATEFRAYSDVRIKNVVGRSNAKADLKTLSKIEVTDYTHKDVVTKGHATHKKLIAQQVEAVFPQAIALSQDVVPDIYQNATANGAWIELATDLKPGERVRLIGPGYDGIQEVLEVTGMKFRTAYEPTDAGDVFVYGREVDDFRVVDYDAISMLSVSATQELHREVISLRERVAELEARDKTRDEKLAAIETLLRKASLQVPVSTSLVNQ